MKLSEAIKAVEDGSKSEFVNWPFKLKPSERPEEMLIEHNYNYRYHHIPLDGWEEVKPPRQWSDKELMLFKLLPDWAKWISIDNDGSVWVFEKKPYLNNGKSYDAYSGNMDVLCDIFAKIITITFEESPIYIGNLKGE